MIESMEVAEKDYLQVFELKTDTANGKPMQRLIHTQEQPEYKNEIVFAATSPVTAKIYVIDDSFSSPERGLWYLDQKFVSDDQVFKFTSIKENRKNKLKHLC